ncbi:MAG: hypothetical protein O3C60_11945 [Planctomycetota bacterium]|nr:hypothetical protein [Planctomycetota bacterium]
MSATDLTRRFRFVLALFMLALIVSGVTAFPLRWELNVLASWMGIRAEADPASLSGLAYWIAYVRSGLERSYDAYPFLAYGTDWLAFAHIVIALFFVGPLQEPTRYDWSLISGIVACLGVVALALICGPLRGIPIYWRCVDCLFGVVGIIPLIYCLLISRRLKAMNPQSDGPANVTGATTK